MSYQGRSYKQSRPHPPGGGGGGGRGRRPPFNNEPQPTELPVLTNQYRLLPLNNPSDYIQYKVGIKNAWYKKLKDEATGETIKDEATGEALTEFQTREITEKDMEKFGKKPYAWRAMKKLVDEHGFDLAYDGHGKAYSPSAASGPEVGREYRVKVKRDCEEDDPDSDKVRDQLFALTFHQTKSFPFTDVEKMLRGDQQLMDASQEIVTMFQVILTSNAILTKGMISLETNSAATFFPLHEQREILGRKAAQESKDRTKILLSGQEMTVNRERGAVVVQVESVVKYANKETFQVFPPDQRHRNGERVPLLSIRGRSAMIAGVRVPDVDRPVPVTARRAIEEAIGKICVNVEYPEKAGRRPQKNKLIRRDNKEGSKGSGQKIIWSACDPELLTFTHKDQEITVASYLKTQYGITVQYPHMPIVFVDDVSKVGGGWFPIEYCYQAFSKSKENNEEIVSNILRYHDSVAGTEYINEVNMKLNRLSIAGRNEGAATFGDRLERWNVRIENTPVQVMAKCLKPPSIQFKNSSANVNNGSFNLKNKQFPRPAKLDSFAVVDFTNDNRSCRDFVRTIMRVSTQNHGLVTSPVVNEMLRSDRYLDLVTVHSRGRDCVDDALEMISDAVQKAKNFHLYDSQHFYREKNIFFQTYCFRDQNAEFECCVLPPPDSKEAPGLLLNYNKGNHENQYYSHQVVLHNGNKYKARLMVKIRETSSLIDPLDFRYQNGYYQAFHRTRGWTNVQFDGFRYYDPNTHKSKTDAFAEHEIRSKKFLHLVDDWVIDFPTILFAYKPDEDKTLYNRIKLFSNIIGGVQSQCAVMKKFEAQQRDKKDQYASNIATKMNAKLSTGHDKAVSWVSYDGSGGKDQLPWVGDVPTMVIGVSMIHGGGKSAKSVIAVSLCLDAGCMRLAHSCFIQAKSSKNSDTITRSVMKDIINRSIDIYCRENGCIPTRMLFHRDGFSDGSFNQADIEIQSIKDAVTERPDCVKNPISVTYVICQSQQLGFRMAPSNPITNWKGKIEANVPSGTVVDCGHNSFHIVAQHGLKGTSKPVKHIVILNENEAPIGGNCGLTMQNLENLTNQLSMTYSSATKAVREVPTIKYAKKVANQVLSTLPIIEAGCHWFGRDIRLVCPGDDTATEDERRAYLEVRDERGDIMFPEDRHFDIINMPFRNHLGA